MRYTFASCINWGSSKGFDAFAHNSTNNSFCLSDGANSAPSSNFAAEITCYELTNQFQNNKHDLLKKYTQLDQLLIHNYPNTACTSAHLQLNNDKILISYCGDSLIEVFQIKQKGLSIFNYKRWHLYWKNTLDELEASNGPSQLLGCNAYYQAHIEILDIKNPILILLSSDGLHRYTKPDQRLYQISKLDKYSPSKYDLEFICQTLAESAINAGSLDDISVVAIWYSNQQD
jgi:hypothetical protein